MNSIKCISQNWSPNRRDARYIVGSSMHPGSMTFDQRSLFQKESYPTKIVAGTEIKHGSRDPTCLICTLGKLEMMKLHGDFKQKMGNKFSPAEFHNTFFKPTFPPIKLIRETMPGANSGPVL